MEIDWNVITGELITAAMKILIPVVVVLVLKWAAEIWKTVKVKDPALAEYLTLAAQIGYAAAEEYFHNNNFPAASKMSVAIKAADDFLKSLGITMPEDVLHDAIVGYGVTEKEFSWTQPELVIKEEPDGGIRTVIEQGMRDRDDGDSPREDGDSPIKGLSPESPEEAGHGRDPSGYIGVGDRDDDRDADHQQDRQWTAGSDQAFAADEDGERLPVVDEDRYAGGSGRADGVETA